MNKENHKYFEQLDKRTNEYKDWKKSKSPVGLGDIIENITKATGIKSLVKKLFGDDCGCKERQERLNKLFPYKTLCLTDKEYLYLSDLFKNLKSSLNKDQASEILKIYQRVINPKQRSTQCSSCWRKITDQLKSLIREYDKELQEQRDTK